MHPLGSAVADSASFEVWSYGCILIVLIFKFLSILLLDEELEIVDELLKAFRENTINSPIMKLRTVNLFIHL